MVPDSGHRPGYGAIVALLEAATGKKAYHVGKPNPYMFRKAQIRLGLRTSKPTSRVRRISILEVFWFLLEARQKQK